MADTSLSNPPNRLDPSSISPPPEPAPATTGTFGGGTARNSYRATLLTLALRRLRQPDRSSRIIHWSHCVFNQEVENAVCVDVVVHVDCFVHIRRGLTDECAAR